MRPLSVTRLRDSPGSPYVPDVDHLISSILGHNAQLEAALDQELFALNQREISAREELARCVEARRVVEERRLTVKQVEQLYRKAFSSPNGAPPLVDKPPQPSSGVLNSHPRPLRARIGPQRFLMFDTLSMLDNVELDTIASLTRLPVRRVRDQMATDVRLGMVEQDGDLYRLTDAGKDLLDRYKRYKAANGQPLPSVDDPSSDEDEADEDSVSSPELGSGRIASSVGSIIT